MLYDKPATTIDQQIELLQSRGLIISDQDLVRRWLMTVGYYRLSAYWLWFEISPPHGQTRSKTFVEGTRFEDIMDLYVFDRKLRLLVTEAIERIEVALRARWTNLLTLADTAHAHISHDMFDFGEKHLSLLAGIAGRVADSKEATVEHYRRKYSSPYLPPLWIVTELMTFGELSKWFALTKEQRIKSVIAIDLGLPTRESLEGALQLLSYVRNICAHHGRLWNRRTVKRLPYIKRFSHDLVIVETGNQFQCDNHIYNSLIVLIRMLKHQSPDTTFGTRLRALIETRSPVQQAAMGFPIDWPTRQIWL